MICSLNKGVSYFLIKRYDRILQQKQFWEGCLVYLTIIINIQLQTVTFILHYDNATLHTANGTVDYVQSKCIELIGYPANNHDLAPNDSFTFCTIKNKIRSHRFSYCKDAINACKSDVLTFEWIKCFNDLFEPQSHI